MFNEIKFTVFSKKNFIFAAFLCDLFLLSSCSQKITPSFLRDREYDYQRQAVVQVSEINIPKGVDKPDFDPKYILPKGQNVYPDGKSQKLKEVLPPPGFESKLK